MPLDWPLTAKQDVPDERARARAQGLGLEYSEEDSKWIHRDKLAKIESAELQAAGIYVPKARASSRQRRERGAVDAEQQGRQKKDQASLTEPNTPNVPQWDLRTPEEIAEADANAYFASQMTRSGTRIPVAKTSLAPISTDYLERESPAVRRPNEGADGDLIAYPKTRSRSASASTQGWDGSRSLNTKRSVTDGSLRKTSPRKASTSRSGTASGRPHTRSGHMRQPSGTRPSTRAGDKVPEGDPPWVMDSYKPDPRLPPDQQLLPTVARRLQQEKWQKEGKGGDAYDKDFRPLNVHEFAKPPEREETVSSEEETVQPGGEWPLRPGLVKSPKPSQYSTMPRISDKPPLGPVTSPKIPGVQPFPQSQSVEPMTQEAEEVPEKSKGGCGCCVVM